MDRKDDAMTACVWLDLKLTFETVDQLLLQGISDEIAKCPWIIFPTKTM